MLELLVVLAILAVVTALAVRSLDRVEEQHRYESAVRGLQEISDAVLGSPADRVADGTQMATGFVADMGRLPRTSLSSNSPDLELRELWVNPGPPFDVRAAIPANGVTEADQDGQVLVPGGWRGPYLRLPIGTRELLDGWGNPITSPADSSPANPDTMGYARLRAGDDQPLTAAGQKVRIIRILGANGRRDEADAGYDRDETLAFFDDTIRALPVVQVEVLNSNGVAATSADYPDRSVTLRIFGPHPGNAAHIEVHRATVAFDANPVSITLPSTSEVTIGPRIFRAYLHPTGTLETAATERRSAVKLVTLRGGANLLGLTIDR